jgi:hypothetical protein
MTPKKEGWEDNFIDLLSQTCNVSLAAHGAGVSRDLVYRRRKKSKTFKRRWDAAKAEAVELLEAEAWARARKTSDTLMIFLLKAHKPKKYRETQHVKQSGEVKVVVEYANYNPKTSQTS